MKARARVERKAQYADLETELRALLCRSLEGDKIAYAEFLQKVSGMLTRYLSSAVRSGSSRVMPVEDLVQEVLLAIHQKKSTYRTDLPVTPWLLTIARYRLIDSYRAAGRQPPLTSFEDGHDLEEPAAPEMDLDSPDIEGLLQTLPEKQRRVLHLAKVEELPLAEVGEKMNMSLSSVKVTVHRAIATLRKNFAAKSEDHENE